MTWDPRPVLRLSLDGGDGMRWGGARLAFLAQEAQGDLNRIVGVGRDPSGVVGLDLKQLNADEPILAAEGAVGAVEGMSLGPFAGQSGIGTPEVRAILGVVGQQDLRGVTVDRPFLGALGLV